jgi:hypothetical protein
MRRASASLGIAAAILATLLLAPPAGASYERSGTSYLFPVIGGQIDPTSGAGEADAEGSLIFASKRGSVPLRKLTIKATRDPLIAKVGGGQLKVATAAKVASKRVSFGTLFAVQALKLTEKAATRLDKKLRPRAPFRAGQPLGAFTVDSQSKLMSVLDQGRVTIAFDPAFLAKLDSRFVSLNPIFPAEHQGAAFTFPIATGQVFWSELWLDLAAHSDTAEVDLEPTPAFPGRVGRVGVLEPGPATYAADPAARSLSVSAAPLTLSAPAAQSFNEAFAQGEAAVFGAGEAVGAVSFAALGQ